MNNNIISAKVDKLLSSQSVPIEGILRNMALLLQAESSKYTWVGFYFMNNTKQTLHLGPYVGKETEHVVIPYGRGICGQVAISGSTYIAEDVHSESNYIACSLDVKSEIVVPIYHDKKLIAQLDIDSSQPNAFNEADRQTLEEICLKIGKKLGAKMEALIE